jgi:guanine nucleotide-binding protein subunit alpha
MSCIICLVPISAFDEALEEEPEVSRLVSSYHLNVISTHAHVCTQADSIDLWTRISSNKILEKTNLILFLNKIDILQAKLASGIRFSDFVPSYGRRPNDFDSASRCM